MSLATGFGLAFDLWFWLTEILFHTPKFMNLLLKVCSNILLEEY